MISKEQEQWFNKHTLKSYTPEPEMIETRGYTSKQKQWLHDNYAPGMNIYYLRNAFEDTFNIRKTPSAIRGQLISLGLLHPNKPYKRWTITQIKWLKEHCNDYPRNMQKLTEVFNTLFNESRTITAIQSRTKNYRKRR